MKVLETNRLVLRRLSPDDAAFILRLMNEPSWRANIGDRNIRTLEDARRYIETGPVQMYERLGFGLFLVERKEGGLPIGLCGFLKRDTLDHVDIGFALLQEYWGQGYAFESASAAMSWGRDTLGLTQIVAITARHNRASAGLLEKLGFRLEGLVRIGPDAEELNLYAAT